MRPRTARMISEDSGSGNDITFAGRTDLDLEIFLVFVVFGCLVESIGMMFTAVPLLYPVLLGCGIGPIWFGGALVLLIELGQITPLPGRSFFVMQGVLSEKLGEMVRETVLFYILIFIMLGLRVAVPELALWFPSQLAA